MVPAQKSGEGSMGSVDADWGLQMADAHHARCNQSESLMYIWCQLKLPDEVPLHQ